MARHEPAQTGRGEYVNRRKDAIEDPSTVLRIPQTLRAPRCGHHEHDLTGWGRYDDRGRLRGATPSWRPLRRRPVDDGAIPAREGQEPDAHEVEEGPSSAHERDAR